MLCFSLGIAGVLLGLVWRRSIQHAGAGSDRGSKRRSNAIAVFLITVGTYAMITSLVVKLFGSGGGEEISFSVWAARTDIMGSDISCSVLYSWYIIAVLTVIALLLRVTVLRTPDICPSGIQNVLETAVDTMRKYVDRNAHGTGDMLASYLFTVAMYLVGCALVEMLGFRTPASDITVTLALGIISFFLINWYGIKEKGVLGRMKSMSGSNPAVFVLKIFTELAVPVSMACRLFGNMLAGFVIMDLLYVALGRYAVGIPSVVGLYFNVAHPLLQIFIFSALTLTFIGEATE